QLAVSLSLGQRRVQKKKHKSKVKVHKDFYDNDIIFETIATRTTAIVPFLQTLTGCREFINSDEKGNPNLANPELDCKMAESIMEPTTDTPIDTATNTTVDTPMAEQSNTTKVSQETPEPVKKVLKKKSGRRKKVSADDVDPPKTVVIRRSPRLAKKYAKEQNYLCHFFCFIFKFFVTSFDKYLLAICKLPSNYGHIILIPTKYPFHAIPYSVLAD
ncbi:hypothetical protein RFI_23078, partial [Reticulomyxa filosa]